MMKFGIITNTKTGRFHPILFYMSPLPSGYGEDCGYCRFKSKGHHTDGFATIEEADAHIASTEYHDCKYRAEWDGEGIPAIVTMLPI